MSNHTELVTVFAVDLNIEKTSKEGKPYKVAQLTCKGGTGAVEQKLIMNSTINKAPEMKSTLEGLQGGEKVTLVLEQNPNNRFSQIVGVHIGNNPEAQSQVVEGANSFTPRAGGSSYQKPAFDTSGMQVGNALNNAALMLAHGVKKGTLESVSEEILLLSEKLKAKLQAGVYKYVDTKIASKGSTITHKPAPIIEDEDVPFE